MKPDRDPALEPSGDAFRRAGESALEILAAYFDRLRELPIFPDVTADALESSLAGPLPEDGAPIEALLDVFRDVLLGGSRHNGHPRFFGYVAAPGTAATALADLLASGLNANVTSWRSAPAPTTLERVTIGWVKEIVGWPAEGDGLFVSGGSMANFAGLAAARRMKLEGAHERGLAGGPVARVYASAEAHHSVHKAANLLGLGLANVRTVATDAAGRLDVADLERLVAEDVRAGHVPLAVVGSAGTVSTGAIDPLDAIADAAQRHDLWFHVDASYGGFAALAPEVGARFAGLGRADSISLDPHKWLYVPVDCGCVLYRNPAAARAAFGHDAEYTRVTEREPAEAYAFWDYGPELSRRFRALKVWTMLKHVGRRALADAVRGNIACARHISDLAARDPEFELLAEPGLSIFCLRFVPRPGMTDAELDALNERIMVALQRGGEAYVSNARVNGKFALRGCVINFRTTLEDMERTLEAIRKIGRQLS